LAVSVGVKVTEALYIPALGAVDGVVKAKLPLTEADPLLRIDALSAWP
jgi:hypothetical protein